MNKFLAAAALVAMAGCSGNTLVSTRVGAAGGGLPLQVSDTVTVDRIRITVRAVELRNSAEGSEAELEAGPFLLDLAGAELDGTLSQQFAVDVPAGQYDLLEFEVHKLSSDEAAPGGLGDMKTQNAAIIIDGQSNGTAYAFVSEVDTVQTIAGAFDIGEGTNNVTLNIDTSGWFLGTGGAPLDPANAEHRSQIEANIKASIDAFDDDDQDGGDDDL